MTKIAVDRTVTRQALVQVMCAALGLAHGDCAHVCTGMRNWILLLLGVTLFLTSNL